MIKNYVVIAYRTLFKNRVYSGVNIVGLSIGVAAFLFIMQYVQYERSYESFHLRSNDIFRVTLDLYNGPEYIVTDCETYAPLGPALKEKMPEVQDYVRMFSADGILNVEVHNQIFLEDGVYFTDPSYFNIFTSLLIAGNPATALNEPMQVVLTESMAKKLFGRNDIIGESINIDNNLYKITGVLEDQPFNTHMKFKFLVSHSSLAVIYDWYSEDSDAWSSNNEYTYLLMTSGTDLPAFNVKLVEFSTSMGEKLHDEVITAERIADIHLYSTKSYEPEPPGSARTVDFMMIIALFVIAIAWVNYINLATARAVERAREVGIRKILGSVRRQLILQFLAESIAINILATGLALVLFQSLLPLFRELTGQPLSSEFLQSSGFWFLVAGIVLVGSISAGLYPAVVLSSFQPVAVLKGKFRSSLHGQRLRKGLVVFQFATTSLLIGSALTVYLQINHLIKQDLGMNLDHTLLFRAPQLMADSAYQHSFEFFKAEMLKNSDIRLISRSGSVPGLSINELSSRSSVKRLDQQNDEGSYNYYHYWIDAQFIPALDMRLIAGRNFEDGGQNLDQVLINEESSRLLGFSSPQEAVGSRITFYTRENGEYATIIGVLEDFHQRSPKEASIPMILQYGDWAHYFVFKIAGDNPSATLSKIKTTWDEVFPGSAFQYSFLDQMYNQQYTSDTRFGRVVTTFSALIILIACLGLFGLSSYTILQRTKEIGIRKVMGASVTQIVRLLSQDFVRVVFIAALIGLPVAWWAMDSWLSTYASRIDLNIWMFLAPVVVIVLIALATVALQTVKSAMSNPVDALRNE